MKNSLYLNIFLLCLLACKNQSGEDVTKKNNSQVDSNLLFEKSSEELKKFTKDLINLYTEAEKNTERTILKADSLENEIEKDPIRAGIKRGISNSLHYLKAELFFKLSNYQESIIELNKVTYKSGDIAIALASNYSKLKSFDKARSYLDSIGKGYYLYNYVLGNFYENIGDKKGALKIYKAINDDKSIKHHCYYELALKRLEELQKRTPVFLSEIYFPTKHPKFEYCYSDNKTEE